MRKIKFKGWDTIKKVMYSAEEMGQDELTINPDGRGFVNVNGSYTNSSQYMTHIIPLEYTGLKDKDEKDIYEKDIIETEHISYNVHGSYEGMVKKYGVVEFNYGKFGLSMTNGGFEDISFSSKYHKIIGNIYSNPELLTKE